MKKIIFNVKPQKYIATDYIVEGDFSSASYLLAATAIAGGYIKVENLFSDSKQGDKFILDILEKIPWTRILKFNEWRAESGI
jgi:3-phosphoshikimate 1-carboxyvinyltransferase